MFRFMLGFFAGFFGMLFYLNKNSSEENVNKDKDLNLFPKEDPYRIINIMKEFQKMREKI
jgi:hypothetical protein